MGTLAKDFKYKKLEIPETRWIITIDWIYPKWRWQLWKIMKTARTLCEVNEFDEGECN